MDSLQDNWGISLGQRIIIDSDHHSEPLGYDNHPITENLKDNISCYQLVRPLVIQSHEGIAAESFLASDSLTWGETDFPSPGVAFDPSFDLQGPVDFGVAPESQLNDKENSGN